MVALILINFASFYLFIYSIEFFSFFCEKLWIFSIHSNKKLLLIFGLNLPPAPFSLWPLTVTLEGTVNSCSLFNFSVPVLILKTSVMFISVISSRLKNIILGNIRWMYGILGRFKTGYTIIFEGWWLMAWCLVGDNKWRILGVSIGQQKLYEAHQE